MIEKGKHPYLDKYPLTKAYKYLVIGTIPPAKVLPAGEECKGKTTFQREFTLDYFYGNAASFWKLLKEVYPESDFSTVEGIQVWQDAYCIEITDTIQQCRRKDPCSPRDSDLLLENEDYNHSLKSYVLAHQDDLEKLIFTSSKGQNNALANFKKIMGQDVESIGSKVVADLPSPSGAANIAYFTFNEKTQGLKEELYNYLLQMNNPADSKYVEKQWQRKKAGEKVKNSVPPYYITQFKIWKYRQIFPAVACVS
jgi:hypothetical protein